MLGLILTIQKIVALVQLGLTTFEQVKSAVDARRLAVTESDETPISPERLEARFAAVSAHGAEVGDEAGARIAERDNG